METGLANLPSPIDPMFGFRRRNELHPGEDKFFRNNPNVAGMAAEDNTVILNPYAGPSVNKDAVARNEAMRLHMRRMNVIPSFDLTPEQQEAFKGTAYGSDPNALKASIAARIYSGDPSANATQQQREWVIRFLQGQ